MWHTQESDWDFTGQLERPGAAQSFHILTGRLSSSQCSWKSDCTRKWVGEREEENECELPTKTHEHHCAAGLFREQIIKSASSRLRERWRRAESLEERWKNYLHSMLFFEGIVYQKVCLHAQIILNVLVTCKVFYAKSDWVNFLPACMSECISNINIIMHYIFYIMVNNHGSRVMQQNKTTASDKLPSSVFNY